MVAGRGWASSLGLTRLPRWEYDFLGGVNELIWSPGILLSPLKEKNAALGGWSEPS